MLNLFRCPGLQSRIRTSQIEQMLNANIPVEQQTVLSTNTNEHYAV
jgi:hypothetical protein